MNYSNKLKNLLEKNGGVIFSKSLDQANIPRIYLAKLVERNIIERIERGVYITKNSFDDEMYRLQVKYSQIIYSHDTALFLHDLTDRDPIKYSVTVKAGYNASNIKSLGLKVYSIKEELYKLGIIIVKTQFDHDVKIYDVERTICDILRSRNHMDIDILTGAIKRYAKNKNKNIPKLMELSKLFRVEKILRSYLEVLL